MILLDLEYELVNQLLDRAIVADPSRRYRGAESLAAAVDRLVSVALAGGQSR
jgi:hypothetical protein